MNNKWYSIIVALFVVGFLMALTSGIFLLILRENKDTLSMEYQLKWFAAAEWAVEVWLLKAKQNNYSYSEKIEDGDPLSKVFFEDPNQRTGRDVALKYDIDGTANEISDKKLWPWEYNIIPLFYFDKFGVQIKVTNIVTYWLTNNIVWNIVSSESWISWLDNFNNWTKWNQKLLSETMDTAYKETLVWDFLEKYKDNYLILHNTWNTLVRYSVEIPNPGEKLTTDNISIIWTWEIAWYKQNLKVSINSSEYLNLLKYSIYSDEL